MKNKMDFKVSTYKNLLASLQSAGYSFQTFYDYLKAHNVDNKESLRHDKQPQASSMLGINAKVIILRHDVEKHYENSLCFAQIQNNLGIKGTYYFRFLPKFFKPDIVKQIAALGHEIGYHYDDLAQCKGDFNKAISRFENNLSKLRKIAPVNTICMDGSPLSKFDNKYIWKQYNYHNYEIIGEPYFDLDFNEIFYLTDTGRRWDGWNTSVRDKVPQQELWNKQGLTFHSTQDIIVAIESGRTLNVVELPNQIMMTFHPQRWTNGGLHWIKELFLQGVKNRVKKILIKIKY